MSIWLKVVEFILPKRLSSPKILCIICFINEGNFPVTHIMVLIVLKVTVKWLLFDCIPFHETPTHWFVIVKSRLNLSLLPVYCLEHVWHGNGYTTLLEQQLNNIVGTTVQATTVVGLNEKLPSSIGRSKCFSSYNIAAYFALVPSRNLQLVFFFSKSAT